MGRFTYEGTVTVEIEDRALSHLQFVIADKLRRNEPFLFTWHDDPAVGQGRTTAWLSPRSDLTFTYHGSRQPPLNRAWLELLAAQANSPQGLHLVREPELSRPMVEPPQHAGAVEPPAG